MISLRTLDGTHGSHMVFAHLVYSQVNVHEENTTLAISPSPGRLALRARKVKVQVARVCGHSTCQRKTLESPGHFFSKLLSGSDIRKHEH